ncbi:hypothetical protein RN001_010422 [Aquatica leii]|uniref:Uncharacterized protein n=1 Tax=Aquatica leii TaxID=1421715 RepID=A0AAN7P9J8_9COLE|nr:hypothetical protein RN001_010422 [Aquatica leii]
MVIHEGEYLAHPEPGDEIVITGMAGRFPESDNISEYFNNICAKKDMITSDNRRWLPTNPEVPHRSGKINFVEKLDAGYFGIHHYQATQLDPMNRQLLERTYEAFLDAGLNVNEVRGSKIGVYLGVCISESEEVLLYGTWKPPVFGMIGSNRSMMAHFVSYHFGLQGPSHTVDTACSSSLYALEHGYRAIRLGKCDAALIGGVSLCLNPLASLQFNRLGVLSMDGSCKAFDEAANGYARSETVSVVLLQKAKDARRIYAQILHVKTNSDGYKEQGITFPSSQMQKELVEDAYHDCNLNPTTIDFLEAHATGTNVGDPEEMAAMDQVFCVDRKRPLYIGSIKSYLGHAEGASGVCSLVKVVLGMENGVLLPNINFKTPRQSIKGIIDGRMIVVTDTMPWPKDGTGLVAVNSFGFGGSNAHAVLKRFQKPKLNDGVPFDDLPRLVCISGRTFKSVVNICDDVSKRALDAEYIRLLQQAFKDSSIGHSYRGFILQSKSGEVSRKVSFYEIKPKYLCLVLPPVSKELVFFGRQLMQVPVFARSLQRIDSILPVQVSKLIGGDLRISATDLILCSVAIQVSLIDLFKAVNVCFDHVLGASIGEFSAGYANGELTLEETILNAYQISTNPKNKVPAKAPTNIWHRVLHPTTIEEQLARVKRSNAVIISLDNCEITYENGYSQLCLLEANAIESLLTVLGCIHTMGYSIHCENLYPEVKWPVSVHTPMLSTLPDWNHEEDWFTFIHANSKTSPLGQRHITLLNREIDWSFLPGHVIDGMVLMPATGYLYMVWETFCKTYNFSESETKIVFEDVKFHRATQISKNSSVVFKISIARETRKFEIGESDQPLVSGKIYSMNNLDGEYTPTPMIENRNKEMSLNTKDFYKELKLRGYNYSGAFCAVQKADLSGKTTWIKWEKNWITFMDNMLQTKLLQEDTRNLYVPTFIERLVVDAPKHMEYGNELGDEAVFPVYNNKEAKRLFASSIARRKARGEPVLESYKFIPFNVELDLENAARVFTQILLENTLILKVKVVEIMNGTDRDALAPAIQRALDEQPLIKTEISVFSLKTIDVPNIKSVKTLDGNGEYSIIVVADVLTNPDKFAREIVPALKDNGVVIAREDLNCAIGEVPGFEVISTITTSSEKLLLLKKTLPSITKLIKIVMDGSDFSWVSSVQQCLKDNVKALLVIEGEVYSGALGFINCLRREPGGAQLQCLYIMDRNVRYNPSDSFFKSQLKKSLAINVLKNNVWGTYRHLPLNTEVLVERDHMFNCATQIGNLSSLRWVEGPITLNAEQEPETMLVSICYSALNFKDLMIASGRIGADAFSRNRLDQIESHAQGFEYSGIDQRGRRIMGMVCNGGAISSYLKADPSLSVDVPEHWSLEDAATVTATYGTVLFSLCLFSTIKKGQSILIHAGSGGIGQAALHIATFLKCNVFTTVSTEEKRQFIRANFPDVPDHHIGNSRDTSFERMIYKETKGRGVDFVLNSLAEEKLLASVRCLAPHGKFIEIGKYDLLKNNVLPLSYLAEGRCFYGTMLDLFFKLPPTTRVVLIKLLNIYLDLDAVKPLHRVVFNHDEVEQAFRYMAAGKHLGKILIRVRDEEKLSSKLFTGLPRYYCNSDSSYVVVGGLGGFGLELVDWLVVRGARKLVLVSRSGIKTGYAAMRINVWKSYQVIVEVSTDDVTTRSGSEAVLTKAGRLGPVSGIFNLAVVLRDNLFENQNEESFLTSLAPKALATYELDIASRELCPSLKHFVVFSSVSCGRGNPGQTNYGMSNSIMERICEQRKMDGYPALAIQWGAIGEVGLVAEMQELQREIEIGGTLQQRVASCLSVLDTFLTQDEAIVASMVVAEKRSGAEGTAGIIDVIKNIMGITDLKTISEHAALPELGMDSMTALEVKQTLERECELFLSAKEIRTLTFSKLKEMLESKMVESEGTVVKQKLNVLHRFIGFENDANIPIKRLPSLVDKDDQAPTVFLLPGVEGMANVMEPLACNLKAHAYCLQYVYDNIDEDTVESLADSLLQYVPEQQPFYIVAYSYGCIIGLHLVSLLEARGQKGVVVLIDGALEMFREVVEQQYPGSDSKPVLETIILANLMQLYLPVDVVTAHKETLVKFETLEERVNYTVGLAPNEVPHSKEYQERVCYKSCFRMSTLFTYQPNFDKIQSPVILFKPSQPSLENFDEDYRIQKYCENTIEIRVAEGNHLTILKNLDLANIVNNLLNPDN